MSTLNDVKRNYLSARGFNGTLSDMESAWRIVQGFGKGSLWPVYTDAGLTGQLNDMAYAFFSAFSPSDLFRSGEDGAWYDPSSIDTLFQTSNGATPVASDTDPSGLVLDVSSMGGVTVAAFLAGQTEILPNGTFDTDTEWSKGAGWTIGSGVAAHEGDTGELSETNKLTAGKFYFGPYEVLANNAAGTFAARYGDANSIALQTTVGEHTLIAKAGVANATYSIRAGASNICTIDNLSLKELTGNHALQATAGLRPLYKTSGGLSFLDHDGVDDVLAATFPDLGTNATVAYVTSGGVTILTGQTISGATNLIAADWYGLIYLDRAFTAAETASVTSYLEGKAGI